MRIERVLRGLRGLACLLGAAATLGGCAAGSLRRDLRDVSAATGATFSREVTDERAVSEETERSVRGLVAGGLSADTALRVAMLNNRALRAQLRELGVARGQLIQAGVLPNPSVTFDLRRSTDRAQDLQVDVEAEIDLTEILLRPLRVGVANASLQAARARAASEVVRLRYSVRAAFYRAQAAEARLVLARRALDAFAASRDAGRMLFEAGNIARLDLSLHEAAYEQARIQLAQAELEVLGSTERLQRLLGLSGADTAWQLTGEMPALPAEAPHPEGIENTVILASFDLAAMRARLESLARRTGLLSLQGWLPDVSVDVHAEQDGNAWELGGGVRAGLPVFNRQQGNLRAAEAEFDGLRERYIGLAIDLRSEAREARGRVALAWARAHQWGDVIVPARDRVMQETQLQYNAMQVGVFQLLNARREQLEAAQSAVSARADYLTAQAALDALVQGARVEALDAPQNSVGASGAAQPDRH